MIVQLSKEEMVRLVTMGLSADFRKSFRVTSVDINWDRDDSGSPDKYHPLEIFAEAIQPEVK